MNGPPLSCPPPSPPLAFPRLGESETASSAAAHVAGQACLQQQQRRIQTSQPNRIGVRAGVARTAESVQLGSGRLCRPEGPEEALESGFAFACRNVAQATALLQKVGKLELDSERKRDAA